MRLSVPNRAGRPGNHDTIRAAKIAHAEAQKPAAAKKDIYDPCTTTHARTEAEGLGDRPAPPVMAQPPSCLGTRVLEDPQTAVSIAGRDVRLLRRISGHSKHLDTPEVIPVRVNVMADFLDARQAESDHP
jgi:hypothetical protein